MLLDGFHTFELQVPKMKATILLLETSVLSFMQFLGAESSRNVTGDSFTSDATLSAVITRVFPNHNGPESGSFGNHHSNHPLR